jgi:hypothetical protein
LVLTCMLALGLAGCVAAPLAHLAVEQVIPAVVACAQPGAGISSPGCGGGSAPAMPNGMRQSQPTASAGR